MRSDEAGKVLTVGVDVTAGSRFAVDGATGSHPVHDTVTTAYRRLREFHSWEHVGSLDTTGVSTKMTLHCPTGALCAMAA